MGFLSVKKPSLRCDCFRDERKRGKHDGYNNEKNRGADRRPRADETFVWLLSTQSADGFAQAICGFAEGA